ncbi:cupin domain-containing protein [Haliea sp.]
MSASVGVPGSEDRFHTDNRIWHRTDTIDYVVVVQGSPILHLEDRDIALKPLDAVVQRGTMHAWSNPTEETAVLACTLVDAKPIENLRQRTS